ncbi:hypothetical protein M2271_006318 [Streptomyces sp. LBL]|uniref:hypothetical protein n=1 Tax=Streptomyces sp. LBL TaxID=2940562 RepID=UPI00247708C2|nr:hypothetical protein [Streptomyces sp. LBL]MDH6628485.1 hypothetical protein [Streptomyces sp. LBL]
MIEVVHDDDPKRERDPVLAPEIEREGLIETAGLVDEGQHAFAGLFFVVGVQEPFGDPEYCPHEQRVQWWIGEGPGAVLLAGSAAEDHRARMTPLSILVKGFREGRCHGEGSDRRPGQKHETEQRSEVGEVVSGRDQPADARCRLRADRVEEIQKSLLKAE